MTSLQKSHLIPMQKAVRRGARAGACRTCSRHAARAQQLLQPASSAGAFGVRRPGNHARAVLLSGAARADASPMRRALCAAPCNAALPGVPMQRQLLRHGQLPGPDPAVVRGCTLVCTPVCVRTAACCVPCAACRRACRRRPRCCASKARPQAWLGPLTLRGGAANHQTAPCHPVAQAGAKRNPCRPPHSTDRCQSQILAAQQVLYGQLQDFRERMQRCLGSAQNKPAARPARACRRWWAGGG